MNKTKSVNLIAIIIGVITFGIGLYQLTVGYSFNDYFMSFFLGTSLAGTGFINHNKI